MKKNTYYHSHKPKRFYVDLVKEKPSIFDITLPNDIFWRRNALLFLFRFPYNIIIRLYFLLRWDKYTFGQKEEIKQEYFRDYWQRQRKKYWISYPHDRL